MFGIFRSPPGYTRGKLTSLLLPQKSFCSSIKYDFAHALTQIQRTSTEVSPPPPGANASATHSLALGVLPPSCPWRARVQSNCNRCFSSCLALYNMVAYDFNMAHTYSNINIHIIFHTKATGITIREEHLPRMFQYIRGIIQSISGHTYIVGGRPDHIHILLSLPVTQSVSELVRSIKSNTSKWIKAIHPEYQSFSWQEGYGVFSVSESNKSAVIDYIANQSAHHRRYTAQEEFERFLRKNGLQGVVSSLMGAENESNSHGEVV